MGATTIVSVEEYLRNTEKPHLEYREGVLHPKPMATTLHGMLQVILGWLLLRQGYRCGTEITVRISESKYLIPDVIAAKEIEEPYPTSPVHLCCEILSPEDRLGQTLSKCEEYHDWGVPYCWVIDPERRVAWEYPKDGEPARIADIAEGKLHAGEIEVSLAELFGQLGNAGKE
ncbi:MAG: Uma2 family endonuclease [Bryobacter sp.]|nr:Uma2 family endonuclease [Bryobacter sp.]